MSAEEEHTTLTRDAGIVGFFALGSQLFGLESSPSSLTRATSLVREVLIVPGMLTCVDAIVEHPNIVVRYHRIDETNVHALVPAVCIAQARIDFLGCDLRLADAVSMLTDLIPKCSRTSTEQCSKGEEPQYLPRS